MQSNLQTPDRNGPKRTPEEYSAIAESAYFQKLIREKKKFIIPFTVFFFCFYFALPILTSYTTILNQPFIGSITWAWVLAFLQFVMTWAFCMIYYKKAASFDKLSEQILAKKGR
ncbi:uncharacterized membrane protein (DUF485 family) [Paenibacillus shirakamiensis]|uniref:Uncharacterized membrane protein (DUF485 family) n=1 Tax=Paenibacillus shirakamiensis TaxID=1265935 RepID=A0ABS4JLN0_9BACL|nr:DUF485 domain-containing protein [Paenibacillus shirakamiensis]MBP2002000.1 uncharacterized membrane protein (DUF485 family) [Paenibacillus shirakamiensis]